MGGDRLTPAGTRTSAESFARFGITADHLGGAMGRRVLVAILIAGGMAAVLPLLAQEGHPLVGTWHGEWHPAAGQRSPVVMFMKWDTKNITGVINPGPRSMALKTATLDPAQWA